MPSKLAARGMLQCRNLRGGPAALAKRLLLLLLLLLRL
jgi:hypothetical protein